MPPWLVYNLDTFLSGASLLTSVVGLAVAVWQAVKARRAAEAARDAANRAEKQIGRQVLLTDVSASLRILEEIRTLMRAMRYEPALMRTSDLIGQLTQVRQVKGGTNPLDLGGMLTQLH